MTQLSDAVAVVTGGASGNGREICRTFAAAGADVVVADVREEPRQSGPPTHELVETEGGRGTFVNCDVTNRADLDDAVEAAEEFGGVNVMVNNAGIFRGEEFLEVREEGLQQFLDVNVKGVFFGSQVAAERMLDSDGGSIVNMSSIGSIRALGAYTAYDLTKGAVASMTYSLADRFGDAGIRVNAIMPGIIGTAMTEEDVPIVGTDHGDQYATESIPMERFGTPEEVADAALFLASDQSSYVNGESLVVNGGVTHTG
ncbi:SDR family oxidoreductase [Natrinema gelatinilyticum]|uniref:SDR family oxidoreductase n=1 Tax=Natrinema gelatinilyticum TaxID=2961571 RepID=UPI0020C3A4D8|nr:SDR family oxidoreductase [Natrinema gelatinilyticum]